MPNSRRFPAEWEPQDGVLLAWPHADSDWAARLDEVEPVFFALAQYISAQEIVLILCPDPEALRPRLLAAGIDAERLRLVGLPTNDTWTRDYGPLTVMEKGVPKLLDFTFNGWGMKFAACYDNLATRRLHQQRAFGHTPLETVGMVFEGGSVESDGRGTLLVTANCLLEENRNPHLSRRDIDIALRELLGAHTVLWLHHGYLEGDDTDAHVDTLARLCPNNTIAYVQCSDPFDPHFQALGAMEKELHTLLSADGTPYQLVPLPWPKAQFDEDGARLPATYANYLVINQAVLVPTYSDPANDRQALEAIGSIFPDRTVIGIDCRPLIKQHGSLHCVTMQIPSGVLA